MKIAIISKDFPPFTSGCATGEYAASLAGEFVKQGHNVCLFLPMPEGFDVASHSLARRLVSLSVTIEGNTYECIRYDGRTTSGVQVYLVEVEGLSFNTENSNQQNPMWEIFLRGVAEILLSLDSKYDWCLTLDTEIAAQIPILKNEPYGPGPRHMHLSLTAESESPTLTQALKQADCVVATNFSSNSGGAAGSNPELEKMIVSGLATVLPIPGPSEAPRSPADKISSKTTFQIRHGLPVRPKVPVVLFSDRVSTDTHQLLRSFLKSDVQAIALKGDDTLQSLADTYPDRLALIDSDKESEALESADGYVVGDDPSLATMALSKGTIPIGGPGIANGVVDLEPSCRSGSGILLNDLSFPSLLGGLERLTTACAHEADFLDLCSRVQRYVPTWADVARYFTQLMKS